jgi:hypothetical protein
MTKSTNSTTNKNTKKKTESNVKLQDAGVAALFKNEQKNTKTVQTKTKTTTSPSFTAVSPSSATVKLSKNKKELVITTKSPAPVTTPPATFSLNDNKKVGSGANQAGKRRGSYNKNLWAIEFRAGDQYLSGSDDVYTSRDEARIALNLYRTEENYKVGDARLAKYVFSAVDKS